MNPINNSAFRNIDALRASQNSSNIEGVNVDGNTISWPDDGWYSVQSATSYNTMSEGGRSANMPAGTYNVINHTTGERFENLTVGPQAANMKTKGGEFTTKEVNGDKNPIRGSAPEPSIDRSMLSGGGYTTIGFNGDKHPIPGSLLDPDTTSPFSSDAVDKYLEALNGPVIYDFSPPNVVAPAKPAPPPPPLTTTTSTVYGEGKDETHVISTTTPDTSAPTSNQPFTTTTIAINPRGVLFTETTVRSPTGETYRPAGLNGVDYSDTEESSPAPEEPVSRPSRPVQTNSSSDYDNSGGGMSSSESAESGGYGTSEGGEFG